MMFTVVLLFVICPSDGLRFPEVTCWPLCGRLPVGSTTCDLNRCGSCLFSDLPIDNTFGPRLHGSKGNVYDWHRGIDIETPVNTSLFAVAAGKVEDIKSSSSDGISIQLRHYPSGEEGDCSGGCYFTRYLHASLGVVEVGEWVETGQLIGFSGVSASGYAHLHFELRSAKSEDPQSDWQRECISPLRILQYCPGNSVVETELLDYNKVSVTTSRKDIVKIELVLSDDSGLLLLPSVNEQRNVLGIYDVSPSFFDIEALNYQYTHKDSTSFSWESFGADGSHQCPFYGEHEISYDASLHLDRTSPNNASVGSFNGLYIVPYKEEDQFWGVVLTFDAMNETIRSMVQCTVVDIYAAEFGSVNKVLVNSSRVGKCRPESPDGISSTAIVASGTIEDSSLATAAQKSVLVLFVVLVVETCF